MLGWVIQIQRKTIAIALPLVTPTLHLSVQ